jgi:DNA uptake protein ComE-like DNA-binding protein
MRLRLYTFTFALALLGAFAGCTKEQNPQELKERTAQATAELKRDAKAVAEGVREGWNRDKPLNVNTATKDQLTELPGINAAEANSIIAGRPYSNPAELVTRHILPKAKYDRIADRLTAKPAVP